MPCFICSPSPPELGIHLSIDDFDAISRRTPFYLADLTPAGKFVASDYQAAGGSRLLIAPYCRRVTRTAQR